MSRTQNKFIDFDEAWKERDDSPVVVRMFGQDWELPGSISAKIMLDVIRLQAESGPEAELNEAQLASMLARIVPEEIMNQWLDRGLAVDQYGDAIMRLISLYTGQPLETLVGEQGEAPAPNEGAETTQS